MAFVPRVGVECPCFATSEQCVYIRQRTDRDIKFFRAVLAHIPALIEEDAGRGVLERAARRLYKTSRDDELQRVISDGTLA